MNKIKPEIKDDIAETLFIPLLSRAHESHRKDAILDVYKRQTRVENFLFIILKLILILVLIKSSSIFCPFKLGIKRLV